MIFLNWPAAYFFYIIKNHPFVDGNKRTGLLTAITFLEINNYSTDYEMESLYELTLDVADSRLTLDDVTQYFDSNQKYKN